MFVIVPFTNPFGDSMIMHISSNDNLVANQTTKNIPDTKLQFFFFNFWAGRRG